MLSKTVPVGQPRGDLVGRQLSSVRAARDRRTELRAVQEVRREQHPRDHRANALARVGSHARGREARRERRELVCAQRSTIRPRAEALDELPNAGHLHGAGGIAARDAREAVARDRSPCDRVGRAVVLLEERRRDAQIADVVVEDALAILRSEIIGGLRRVPQQIADGVVVLVVGQPSQRRRADCLRFGAVRRAALRRSRPRRPSVFRRVTDGAGAAEGHGHSDREDQRATGATGTMCTRSIGIRVWHARSFECSWARAGSRGSAVPAAPSKRSPFDGAATIRTLSAGAARRACRGDRAPARRVARGARRSRR